MFGYITPFKPEMRMREWNMYRAYYCGLCHTIKREYGELPRLALNYDFVTIALFCDAINNEAPQMKSSRCIASPHKKKCFCVDSRGLRLAAACQVLAVYYKLADDAADERGAKRWAAKGAKLALKRAQNKAAQSFSDADLCLKTQMELQIEIEKSSLITADMAAEPTAKMTSAMFALCSDDARQQKILARLGLMLGKIIYYLDAAEDHVEDVQNGKFNVFAAQSNADAIKSVRDLCMLCAGDAALSYNLLELNLNRDILDNIIYLGVEQSISFAGKKRGKKRQSE